MSLVRKHTEALQPPRALWVPFMLGRPLGVPDDPAFQKRVVIAALKLLERNRGPVLEDFPDDGPDRDVAEDTEGAVCPVNFSSSRTDMTVAETVVDEIAQLRIWHDLVTRRRGHTTVGVTGASMDEVARFIAAWADGSAKSNLRDGLPIADALRQACEGIKTFYFEARIAQPGSHTSTTIGTRFWQETAAGRLFLHLQRTLENNSDPDIRDFARNFLVPRAIRYTT